MAAKSNYIPTHKLNPGHQVAVQMQLLRKHFCFLDVSIHGDKLVCIGSCQPSDYSKVYTYRLSWTPGQPPVVHCTFPEIAYHKDIHMYSDRSLCLYYPPDYHWTKDSDLFDTIIPWTHEWFVFYELFKICGKWLHPAVAHKGINK